MGISKERRRELVELVNGFVENNLRATLTVKEIAQGLGRNPVELNRLYRDEEGVTIKQTVTGRLKEAFLRELSRNGTNSYSLRREFGFSSIRHLYRWTKAAFGESYGSLHARLRSNESRGKMDIKGTQIMYRKRVQETSTRNGYRK